MPVVPGDGTKDGGRYGYDANGWQLEGLQKEAPFFLHTCTRNLYSPPSRLIPSLSQPSAPFRGVTFLLCLSEKRLQRQPLFYLQDRPLLGIRALMGTNYYFHCYRPYDPAAPLLEWRRVHQTWHPWTGDKDTWVRVDDSGIYPAKYHIGKASAGWCFALHTFSSKDKAEPSIGSLRDWVHFWATHEGRILDEYGARLSIDSMLQVILGRRREVPQEAEARAQWLKKAQEDSYGGGVREEVGLLCATSRFGQTDVQPGDGPYDLCGYVFS